MMMVLLALPSGAEGGFVVFCYSFAYFLFF